MMRLYVKYTLIFILSLCSHRASGKLLTDTLATKSGDKVIISYTIEQSGSDISVSANGSDIRFIPSDKLRKKCKGDLSKLKLIVFDKVGGYSSTIFTGEQPKAFGTPSNISHAKSYDGYYVLGESGPVKFSARDNNRGVFGLTAFIAMYEKKNTYRLIGQTQKDLTVKVNEPYAGGKNVDAQANGNRTVAIQSSMELEADNEDIMQALECINAIEGRLESITQLPFPRSFEADVETLYSLKRRITDREVKAKIERALQAYEDKEQELKDAEEAATRQAQAEANALQEQQRQEELERQQAAEEKAQQEAEKQQKRNLWMIIGGAIFAALCFVFNGVFRHFRDIRNQKSMLEMQQSLTRQAESEATRRVRQVVRNKTHQVVNQGRNKARTAVRNKLNDKNNGIKSI